MSRKQKELKPSFDEVRFELGVFMADHDIKKVCGTEIRSAAGGRLLTWDYTPSKLAKTVVYLDSYPKLHGFLRQKDKEWRLCSLIDLFVQQVIKKHKATLSDHLKAKVMRIKIRPGGCISFDCGPDKKFKHVTFGVPRDTTKRSQVDNKKPAAVAVGR